MESNNLDNSKLYDENIYSSKFLICVLLTAISIPNNCNHRNSFINVGAVLLDSYL